MPTESPAIERRAARPYVGIRSRIANAGDLRAAADQGFPRLFGWLHERGMVPAGAPFVRYLAFDTTGDPLCVEVGVPTPDTVSPEGGDVQASALPAGDWVRFVHRGPYTHATEPGLADAHATVRDWIDRQPGVALAITTVGESEIRPLGCLEQFVLGPVDDADYTRWVTELAYLVESRE